MHKLGPCTLHAEFIWVITDPDFWLETVLPHHTKIHKIYCRSCNGCSSRWIDALPWLSFVAKMHHRMSQMTQIAYYLVQSCPGIITRPRAPSIGQRTIRIGLHQFNELKLKWRPEELASHKLYFTNYAGYWIQTAQCRLVTVLAVTEC